MKKLTKILLVALALVLAVSAFVFSASADDAPFLVEGLSRYTWAEALDNADAEHPIKLLGNYTVAEDEIIEISETVTIDLNGNSITSNRSDGALFAVTGEGVELNLVGPGSITVGGTLLSCDSFGAKINIAGGDDGISVVSRSADPLFVIGGENKVALTLSGKLSFKLFTPVTVFDMSSASTLTAEKASLSLTVSAATTPATLAAISENVYVKIRYSDVAISGATMFRAKGETTAITPAIVLCEYSTLASEGQAFGTVLNAGDQYVEMNVRISTVTAAGEAFTAADTVNNYTTVGEGEAAVKEYAKPKAIVYLTGSTYTFGSAPAEAACLFAGNISGVVTNSTVTINESHTAIARGTRLWDGECGILFKVGVRCLGIEEKADGTKRFDLVSELAAPITDGGVTLYHNPESETNINFTFEDIDGAATEFYKIVRINDEHKEETYYALGVPKDSYTIDSSFTTNFEDISAFWDKSNGNLTGSFPSGSVISKGWGDRYGAGGVVASADGNSYYKFEYTAADKDEYPMQGISYCGIFIGQGTKSATPKNPTHESDYITIDFDIACDTVVDGKLNYGYHGINLMQRNGTGTQLQNFSGVYIKDNTFYAGKGSYSLPSDASDAGKWTHITFVLEVNNVFDYDEEGNFIKNHLDESKTHVYVNGEYLGSAGMFSSTITSWSPAALKAVSMDEIRFNQTSLSSIVNEKDYSICFDNVAVIHYKNGYVGDICKLFESDEIDTSINLADLSDVVYNYNYNFPSPNESVEPIIVVDDTGYYTVSEALAAISEGSYVELFTDVTETYNASVAFTVYTNGHSFAVSSLTHFIAPIWGEEGAYKISKSARAVTAYWAFNGDYLESAVPIGMIPSYDGELSFVADGKLYEIRGWAYDKNATKPEALKAVEKADVDRGYIILYPICEVTAVEVSFIDAKTGTTETKLVPLGDVPAFEGENAAGEWVDGKYIEFVGWSKTEGGTEPVVLPAVTEENANDTFYAVYKATQIRIKIKGETNERAVAVGELFRDAEEPVKDEAAGIATGRIGYAPVEGATELYRVKEEDVGKTFYPVVSVSRVRVTFLDAKGEVLATEWVDARSTLSELKSIQSGASFAVQPDDATDGFMAKAFSGWKIKDSDDEAIGDVPVTVEPVFNELVVNAIKYNVSFVRLNTLKTSVYVKVPTAANVSSVRLFKDAKLKNAYELSDKVKIEGEEYYRVTFDEKKLSELTSVLVYLQYTYNGETKTASYDVGIDSYFESLLTNPASSDTYKKMAMELMRYCDTYIRQDGGDGLAAYGKYSNDEAYSQYLRDLETVSTLFGDDLTKNDISKTAPYIEKVKMDFKNNRFLVYTVDSIKQLNGGWNAGADNGHWFAQAFVVLSDGTTKNDYAVSRIAVGAVNGKDDIYFTCPFDTNGSGNVDATCIKYFDAFSAMQLNLCEPYEGGDTSGKHQYKDNYVGKYTLAHSITQYEALYEQDKDNSEVNDYLAIARAYYSACYAMREAMGTVEGAYAS